MFETIKIRDALKKIFTIRNEKGKKVITVFNKKFVFRNTKSMLKYLEAQNETNLQYINQLKFLIDSCCDITKCAKAKGYLRKTQLTRLKALKFLVKVFEKYDIQYWIDGGSCLGLYRHQGYIPWDDDIDTVVPRPYYQRALEVLNKELEDTDIQMTIGGIKPDGKPFSQVARMMDKTTKFSYLDIFPYDYSNNSNISKEELLLKLKEIQRQIFTSTFKRKLHSGVESYETLLNRVVDKYKKFEVSLPEGENCYLFRGLDSMSLRGEHTIHKLEDVFPLKKMEFEGVILNAPNNIEQFLKNINEGTYGDLMAFPPLNIMHSHIYRDPKELLEYEKQLEIQDKKISLVLEK